MLVDNESTGEEQHYLLKTAVQLAPLIQQLVPLDCTVAVTDREKFIVDHPSEDLYTDNTGKPIPEGGGVYKAIQTGEPQSKVLPKDIYGVSFKATSVPLKDNSGFVIGCLAMGLSLKNQETLVEAANSFASTSEEVVASTEELAASAQELATRMETLNTLRQEMLEQVQKTETMLNFIKKVAKDSNLLGLNASIEAARVGQEGRGFEVVANEIRQMAENSSNSVEEIKEIIETIKEKTSQISEEVPKVLEISQHQAAATEEISSSVQSLTSYVEDIENISQKL